LAHDISGALLATLPFEKDYRHPTLGKYVDKYLKGIAGMLTKHRMRIFPLIESMTGGTAAVEAMQGAGSRQTQRVFMFREANLPYKVKLAKKLLGSKNK